MPKGVYIRTEKHKEICRNNGRKNGLASTTKFKKGHKVPKEWKVKFSKVNKGRKHSKEAIDKIVRASKGKNNPAWKGGKEGYHRRIARNTIWGSNKSKDEDILVHHLDGDVKNNKIENLQVISRSGHTKLHWQQGDIR